MPTGSILDLCNHRAWNKQDFPFLSFRVSLSSVKEKLEEAGEWDRYYFLHRPLLPPHPSLYAVVTDVDIADRNWEG